MLEKADPRKLIQLFNLDTKGELEKFCRDLVIQNHDFVAFIFAGQAGVLAPYEYANHFSQKIGPHLNPSEEELSALSENRVGFLNGKANKGISKIFQLFKERRFLSAHLFYTKDFKCWHLFYFDQRDTAKVNNHWKYGPYIHFVSDLWPNLKLEQVWIQVHTGQLNFPNKIHIGIPTRKIPMPNQSFNPN